MSLKLMLLAVVTGMLLFVILFMKTGIKEQEEMLPGVAFPSEMNLLKRPKSQISSKRNG